MSLDCELHHCNLKSDMSTADTSDPDPSGPIKATVALDSSGGTMTTVEDEEILEAMRRLGSELGVFAEPAGATAFAGALRFLREGCLDANQKVVVLVTGSGLKDVSAALQATTTRAPVIESVEEAVDIVTAA